MKVFPFVLAGQWSGFPHLLEKKNTIKVKDLRVYW